MRTLEPGFESFAQQLTAQTAAAGIPQHENAIHHCLALGFQAAYGLEPGNIVFERPLGPGNCDLWLRPWDLAIEVKYFRPIPSGKSRPMPQLYGTLLADFNKLVSDARGIPAWGAGLRRRCHTLPGAQQLRPAPSDC